MAGIGAVVASGIALNEAGLDPDFLVPAGWERRTVDLCEEARKEYEELRQVAEVSPVPVAVGFGHLNGLDIPAALTVVITCWLLARYLRKPSGRVGRSSLTRFRRTVYRTALRREFTT